MSKAKQPSNIDVSGISSARNEESQRDKYIKSFVDARLGGATASEAHSTAANKALKDVIKANQNKTSRIQTGLSNGTMYEKDGRYYYTDEAQNQYVKSAAEQYADRLQATTAQNAWEGFGGYEGSLRGAGEALKEGSLAGLAQFGSGAVNKAAFSAANMAANNENNPLEYWKNRIGGIKTGFDTRIDSISKRLADALIRADEEDENTAKNTRKNAIIDTLTDMAVLSAGTTKSLTSQPWALSRAVNEVTEAITGSDDVEYNQNAILNKAGAITKPLDDYREYVAARQQLTGNNAVQIAGNAATTIANMAPTIALGAITGNKELATVAMAMAAGGNESREAYNNGASLQAATEYGNAKELIEWSTEHMFGGIEAYAGGKLLKSLRNKITDFSHAALGKVLLKSFDTLGENVEEGMSDFLAPAAERVYLGSNENDTTFKQAMLGQMPWTKEGLVTLLTTFALNGLNGAVTNNIRITNEEAAELLDIAHKTGDQKLIAYADKLKDKVTGETGKSKVSQAKAEDLRGYINAKLKNSPSAAQAYADAIQKENDRKKAEAEKNAAIQNFVKGTAAEGTDVTNTIDKDAVRSNYGGQERTVSMVRVDGQNMVKLTGTADNTDVAMTLDEVRENDALPDDVQTFVSMLDSKLGENAPAAYMAYDGNMSTGEYALAMQEAIELYAGNGADVSEVVSKMKSGGKSASPIVGLNSTQISVAQSAGNKIYQQKKLDMDNLRTKYAEQAKAIRQARETSAADIRNIDASIAEVGGEIRKAGENLAKANAVLSGMQEGTAEYRQAQEQVSYWENYVTQAESALDTLKKAKTEAQTKAPVQRAKGTISYAGAENVNSDYRPVDKNNLTKKQSKAIKAVEAIADHFNLKFVLFDGDSEGDQGKFEHIGADGTIYININAGGGQIVGIAATLSHELTHTMKQYSPADYEDLKDEILKIYFRNDPELFNRRIRYYMNSQKLDYDGAVDEIIANTCTTMLRDSDAIAQLARDNMTLAQKILDNLRGIVKEAFEDFRAVRKEEEFYEEYRDQFNDVIQLWENGIRNAASNYNNNVSQGIKNTAPESGAKFMAWDEVSTVIVDDSETQQKILENKHSEMLSSGKYVSISEKTEVSKYYPDLRSIKKKERNNILKENIQLLKKDIASYLDGLKVKTYQFSINGNILEAKLYDSGVKEVTHSITKNKANVLLESNEIFNNAEYLYSRPDEDGNPDIYRWDYFYTPIKIGNDTHAGVKIAVRNVRNSDKGQIYNWKIKKSSSLDGGEAGENATLTSVSSEKVSDNNIADIEEAVKENATGQFQKYVDGQISMDELQAEDEYAARYIREGYHPAIAERLAEGDRIRDKAIRFFKRLPNYEGKPTTEDIENAVDVNPYSDPVSGYMNSAEDLLNDIAYAVEWGFVPEKSKNTAFRIMEQMLNQMSTQLQVEWEATYHGKPKFREFAEWYEKRHKKADSTYTVSESMRNSGGVRQYQKWEVEDAAVNHFGTTDDYRIAGYILRDGRMLDFSGAHWLSGYDDEYVSEWRKKNDIRQVDHEDIAEAYDEAGLNSTGDNRLKFINKGNIRLIPEAPGINLSQKTEPTAEQYERIRGFLNQNTSDRFYVDFEKDRDNRLQYQGNINANRVINDIKAYYRTGTAPQQSVVSQFHYQKWDSGVDDTAEESRERVQAQIRLEYENQLMHETIDSLNRELSKLQAKYDKQGLKSSERISELKRELKLTKTPEVRKADAKKLAKAYISKANSTADAEQITDMIVDLGNYIVQGTGETLDEDVIVKKAHDIAAALVENAAVKDTSGMEAYQALAADIKGRKFMLPEEDRGDLDVEGGYDRFRKKNFGRFMLVNEGGTQVDTAYSELQSKYGTSLLPDVRNQGDMIRIMAEAFDLADPDEINPFSGSTAQAEAEFTNDIIYDVLSEELRQRAPTFADEAKAKQDALKAENKELSKELKAETREANREKTRLENALDKTEQRLARVRAEKDAKIAELKEKGTARVQQARAKEKAAKWAKVKEVRELYRERERTAAEKRKESAGVAKYRKQVIDKAGKLYELVTVNNDRKHVPKVLREPLAEFLLSFNFDSKRKLRGGENTRADDVFGTKMQRLYNILSKQQEFLDGDGTKGIDLGGYLDLGDSLEYLRVMAEGVTEAIDTGREFTVNTMTAEELKGMSRFLTGLTRAINNMNTFLANEAFKDVGEAAAGDMRHMQRLGSAKSGVNRGTSKFLNWKNATPYYAMQRFGEGGKSVFRSLVKGWGKMAMNVKAIQEFTDRTYTRKEVNSWKNDVHEVTLSDGRKIRITTAQIMELSMLLEREQAVKHIDHGGIRIGKIETRKGAKKDTINDTKHYHLSSEDILNLVGMLSDRQLQVANELRAYMAEHGAELGNEVSMARFGYEFYDEGPKYYPITTDSNDRALNDKDENKNSSMFRLLNLSASKSLNPNASNALVVGDIFDTFADHMADMAKLNGLGLPVLDAIKWFSYKERTDLGDGQYDVESMMATMEDAFGDESLKYIRTLIKDINGVHESSERGGDLWGKLSSNYKVAAVAANLRVALLQPTSYVRASFILQPQYLAGAFGMKNGYQEAMKYSGTAQWKSMGYYDTNISRNMREQIEHDDSWKDRFVEGSMKLAELGDQRTWGRLWNACKLQARAETGLTGEELNRKTADLFDEVIYATQVMDSTLTRSDLMRSSSSYDKMFTAFMAEPTVSYNILLDAYTKYRLDVRENGKANAFGRNAGTIMKAFSVYAASAAFSAIAESLIDAVRDDDDEEFYEKFLQAFLGEGENAIEKFYDGNLGSDLSFIGKIPHAKDIISTIQGFGGTGNMSSESIQSIIDAVKIWEETINLETGKLDKATKTTYYGKMTGWGKVYKTLQGLSQLSGIPASAALRDVFAIWNNIAEYALDEPDWKITTYNANKLTGDALAAYKQNAASIGMSEKEYARMLKNANTDGSSNVKQDELGEYLRNAEKTGELTSAQIYAIWMSEGWKTSYQDWKAKHK